MISRAIWLSLFSPDSNQNLEILPGGSEGLYVRQRAAGPTKAKEDNEHMCDGVGVGVATRCALGDSLPGVVPNSGSVQGASHQCNAQFPSAFPPAPAPVVQVIKGRSPCSRHLVRWPWSSFCALRCAPMPSPLSSGAPTAVGIAAPCALYTVYPPSHHLGAPLVGLIVRSIRTNAVGADI
jgi:hypothetical protein